MNSRYVSMAGFVLDPLTWAEKAALCDGIRAGEHWAHEHMRKALNLTDVTDHDMIDTNGVADVLKSFRYKVD